MAVAFVEVRPEFDDFRGETEAALANEVGQRPVGVKGQLELEGLGDARQQIAGLESDLQRASGQLQIEGFEQARGEAEALSAELQAAAETDVSQALAPALEEARLVRQEVKGLGDDVSAIPSAFGQGIATGAGEAEAALAAAGEETAALGSTLATIGESAGGLQTVRLLTNEARAAQRQYVTDTRLAAAETRRATVAEEQLFRVRARRSVGVGAFRFAGVGLAAGTAIFAATRALGDLAGALEVTDVRTATWETRLRNLAAATLRGDLVGAFKALADDTREYSLAQLELINSTPRLAAVLREAGEAANLARSTQAQLEGLTQVPQFVQTRIAGAQAAGDAQGEARALEEADAALVRQTDIIRKIATDERLRNAALEEVFRARASIRGQLEDVGGGDPTLRRLRAGVERARDADDAQAVAAALRRQRDAIVRLIPDAVEAGNTRERLGQELRGVNQKLRVARQAIDEHLRQIQEETAREHQFSPVAGAVTELTRLRAAAERQEQTVKQLEADRRRLLAAIDDAEGEAGRLQTLRDELRAVDADIEDATGDIEAEQERHRQEMVRKRLLPSREAEVEAELAGDERGQIAALRSRSREIDRILRDNKRLTREERLALKEEQVSINAQIEGIEASIAAEEQRHADEVQRSRDEAHQSLVDGLGLEEQRLRTAQIRAGLDEGLANDIATTEALIRFYRRQSRNLKLTDAEREVYRQALISSTGERRRLAQQQREAERDAIRAEIDTRQTALEDRLELARLNERTTRDDDRALRDLIAFHRRQSRNQELTLAERRRHLIALRRYENELRDLKGEATDQGASFKQLSFAFLQELQGFTSQLAGNLLPESFTLEPPTTTTTAARPPMPQQRRGPFDAPPTATTAGEAAQRLRDQAGAPASQGQVNELIKIGRRTNDLLGTIATGVGHTEARAQRALSRNSVEVGVD